MRIYISSAMILTFLLSIRAEERGVGLYRVESIQVKGNSRIASDAVLSIIKTRVGEVYDSKVWEEDWRRLDNSGCFQSVQTTEPLVSILNGCTLFISLIEAPEISEISIECEDRKLADRVSASRAGFLGSLNTPSVRSCILASAKAVLPKDKQVSLVTGKELIETKELGGRDVKCVYRVSLALKVEDTKE